MAKSADKKFKHDKGESLKRKMSYNRSSDELTIPLLNNDDNSSKFQLKEGRFLSFCFVFAFIGIVLCVCALPITQIVIGSLFIHQCPVNNFIPIHLIITGLATFTLLIICILTVRVFLSDKTMNISLRRFFVKNHRF